MCTQTFPRALWPPHKCSRTRDQSWKQNSLPEESHRSWTVPEQHEMLQRLHCTKLNNTSNEVRRGWRREHYLQYKLVVIAKSTSKLESSIQIQPHCLWCKLIVIYNKPYSSSEKIHDSRWCDIQLEIMDFPTFYTHMTEKQKKD